MHTTPTGRSPGSTWQHPAPAPLPLMQDLFALEPEAPKPVASDPLSFDALQEKARREGVKGLSAREKAAYLQFLQQKAMPPATETTRPSPGPTEPRSAVERLPTYRPGQQSLTYAGIGSRETPEDVRAIMQQVAGYLERKGYMLQTGDAVGADSAFASGCQRKRIFTAADATELTLEIAQEVHPAPWLLPSFARRLMARNTLQVFGADLDTPVDFLLCWTSDGCISLASRRRETGGTGQAIALASIKGIPVINIRNENWREELKEALAKAGVMSPDGN